MGEVVGPALAQAARLEATTLEHLLFLNERGHRFRPVPLPPAAQFAPAFAALIADFDGDGHEDLVLSQNFFPTALETPRYDAGRSLWLRGDGQGHLTPVPGQHAGLLVYGDQRGAAASDIDHDGRLDLVLTQNGAATKLYHNTGARPGLRVRLVGPPSNPHAIGAQLRLHYPTGPAGPLRELQAGSGYWSHNGPTQVLGRRATPTSLWIRWPDGTTRTLPLSPSTHQLTVHHSPHPTP